MKNAFFISLRYQRAQKTPLVRLIAIFSMVGIALGVAVLIVGLSAMNGFERELNQRILAVVPQVQIMPYAFNGEEGVLENYPEVRTLLADNNQIEASSPFIRFQALIENGTKLKVVQIQGIDPNLQPKVSALSQFINKTAWQHFQKDGGLILGAGIARELNLKVGDYASVLLASNQATDLQHPQQLQIKVTGILQLHGQLDYVYALMPLKEAQQLLGLKANEASGIELRVRQPFLVNELTYPRLYNYSQPLQAQTWISRFGYMYHDIRMVRLVMYLAMALVIGVACFNIVSTLIMAVKDKQGDIAILRTLGATKGFIRRIFLYYGVMTGVKGCILGIVLGVSVALNLTSIIKSLEHIFHHHFLSGGIYFIDFLPSELHLFDVGIVFICALILSLLASIYPAKRASEIKPAKILMHK